MECSDRAGVLKSRVNQVVSQCSLQAMSQQSLQPMSQQSFQALIQCKEVSPGLVRGERRQIECLAEPPKNPYLLCV